jgi:LmbE family N-acetylglucosaminyl deacetylase
MKKKIFYLFAHQDDEFGIFVQIKKEVKKNELFIFYLTSGTDKKINKNILYHRDKESIKTLVSLGVKKKNIFFIGRKLGVKHNKLHLNARKVTLFLENFISNIHKPNLIYTHSWEGGHEDHDTCNLITRRIKKRFKIKNCFQFSLYNSFNTSIIFFKVFNPIEKKNGKKVFASILERVYFIKLLFNYKSQIKIWIGMYPFIIFHYLTKGYNFIEKLNSSLKIERPHFGKLLYEKRNFCKFEILKKKTSFLLKNAPYDYV